MGWFRWGVIAVVIILFGLVKGFHVAELPTSNPAIPALPVLVISPIRGGVPYRCRLQE